VQFKYSASRTFFRNAIDPRVSGLAQTPFFESDLSLQITQPLLQNGGVEVNQARVVVARNTQRVSLLDARLQLEKTLSEVEDAYWQLVQGEAELKIQQDLYEQSVDTAMTLQRRLNQDVSRDTIAQANASLRAREAQLSEARNRLKGLSNALKRRVNDPALNTASAPVILPEDRFIEAPITFDLAEQIEAGLANRAELAQQRIRIDSATVVYKAAQNNLLPSLNMVGSIGTKGADNRFGSAVNNQMVDFSAREYAIGLQLEIPLGNREARAIVARTGIQRQQAIDQYQDLLSQVCQEIKDAHDTVYYGWDRMRRTRQSLYAAQEWLAAIVQQQDVGGRVLDPDFVNRKLAAQESVAQARREYTRAATDYNVGISTLEKAKGTLLKYDNVVMRQEPLEGTGIVKRKQE
jgi:outer membrane protein TolC